MSVDLVKYNGGLSQDAVAGGRGDYPDAYSGVPKYDPILFIGNGTATVVPKAPLFANEQELIDFLTKNNIKVCTTDGNGESGINWLYIAIAAAAGLLGGYLIFSK